MGRSKRSELVSGLCNVLKRFIRPMGLGVVAERGKFLCGKYTQSTFLDSGIKGY